MIAYFDTSALVPLLVQEPSSDACRRIWDDADDIACTRLGYVEVSAALAQAARTGRMTGRQRRAAQAAFEELWTVVQVSEIDQALAESAARCAVDLGLRGYDAVHAASAQALAGSDTVACSGDRQLLSAWQSLGLATYDTNGG